MKLSSCQNFKHMFRFLLLIVFLLTESYTVFLMDAKYESQIWAVNPPDDDGENENQDSTDDSDGEEEDDDDCEDSSETQGNPDVPDTNDSQDPDICPPPENTEEPDDSETDSEDETTCPQSPIPLPTIGKEVKLHILFDQNAKELRPFTFGPGATMSMMHTLKLKGRNGIPGTRAYIRWANYTKYDHGAVLYEKSMYKVKVPVGTSGGSSSGTTTYGSDGSTVVDGGGSGSEQIQYEWQWRVSDHTMRRPNGNGTGGYVMQTTIGENTSYDINGESEPLEQINSAEYTYFDTRGNRFIFAHQSFDAANLYRISRIIDYNNNVINFLYSSTSSLTIIDASQNQYQIEANHDHLYERASGNVNLKLISKITTIPAGQTSKSKSWSYEYNAKGHVISETFNELKAETGYGTYGFQINSKRLLTANTDFKNQTESWVYEQDPKNRWYKSEKHLKNGEVIYFDRSYNAQGYDKFVRYPDGRVKIEKYYKLNIGEYKAEEVLPNGLKISYSRDSRGNVISKTELSSDNVLQRTTTYKYDSNNKMTEKVRDANGLRQTHKFTYANGLLIKEIDPEGFEKNWTYDQFKNVIKYQRVSGNQIIEENYEYDQYGNVTKVVDQLGYESLYEYNALGQLIKKTDRRGFETTYTYDIWGNLKTKTNARGAVVTYEYDLLNRKTKLIDELGYEEIYIYDGNDNIVQLIDKKGIYTNYDFNSLDQNIKVYGNDTVGVGSCSSCGGTGANSKEGNYFYRWDGKLLSYTDLNGTITAYDYDLNSKLVAKTIIGSSINKTILYENDEFGRRVKETHVNPQGYNYAIEYEYNLLDYLLRKTMGLGEDLVEEAYDYDLRRLMVSKVDAKGFVYQYNYDGFGRLVEELNPQGLSKKYEYNSRNDLTKATIDSGNLNYSTSYVYDEEKNLISLTRPDNSVIQSTFDEVGNRVLSIDPLNDEISFGYNLRNEMIQTTDAGSFVTSFTYDELGVRSSVTNALGRVDTFEFDDKSFLINKSEDVNGINKVSQFTRDEFLNITSQIDASGLEVVYEYDSLHRRTSMIEDPSGFAVETSYAYDDLNNLVSMTDAAGFVTQNVYDSLKRLSKTLKPDGGETIYNYDKNSNLIEKIEKINGSTNLITNYEYDELNRLTKTIESSNDLQITTARTYDILGRLIKLMDSNGNETAYVYDSMNRVLTETYADGGVITKTYDLKGRLTSRIDQNNDACQYFYNSRDLLIQKNYGSSGVQVFTYDALRRLISSTDNNEGDLSVLNSFTYDALHRKIQSSQKIGNAAAQITSKTYDAYGHETSCVHPGGRTISKTFTKLHQVDEIYVSGNLISNYDYEYETAADNDKRKIVENQILISSSNIVGEWTYDSMSRVLSKSWSQDGDVLVGFQHSYNLYGNRVSDTHQHNLSDSETYSYDGAQRFTGYNRSNGFSQSWQLDKLANWTSFNDNGNVENRTHNAVNEIVSSSVYGATAHDDNGNMTFHDGKQFVWDTNNRLREVYTTGGNAAIAKYYYNAMNLRVRKDIDTDNDGLLDDTTLYYYCGQKVCEERDGNNNFKRDYVHGGQFIDEVIMTSDVPDGIGTFSLTDLRYSVYAVVDADGAVLERYKYDPYGKRTVMNAGFGVLSESAIGQEFGYTGRRHDSEGSGLMYFRARYYSGELGRFVSRDPLGTALDVNMMNALNKIRAASAYKDGMNLYMAYFAAGGVDPNGKSWCSLFLGAAVTAAVSAMTGGNVVAGAVAGVIVSTLITALEAYHSGEDMAPPVILNLLTAGLGTAFDDIGELLLGILFDGAAGAITSSICDPVLEQILNELIEEADGDVSEEIEDVTDLLTEESESFPCPIS